MKWNDCKHCLPNKYESVLVWVKYRNGTESFTESWLENDEWAMGSAEGFRVTHWMYICKPNSGTGGNQKEKVV